MQATNPTAVTTETAIPAETWSSVGHMAALWPPQQSITVEGAETTDLYFPTVLEVGSLSQLLSGLGLVSPEASHLV